MIVQHDRTCEIAKGVALMSDDSQDAVIGDREKILAATTVYMGHVYLLRHELARRKIVSPGLGRVYRKMRFCMEYASYGSVDVVGVEGVSWQCRRILNEKKCPCEFSSAADGDGVIVMGIDELADAHAEIVTEVSNDVAYEIVRAFQQIQFDVEDEYAGIFDLLGRLFVLTPNVPRQNERRVNYKKLNSLTLDDFNLVEKLAKASRKAFRDGRDAIVHARVGTVAVRNGQLIGINDLTGLPFRSITYEQLEECVMGGYMSAGQVSDTTLRVDSEGAPQVEVRLSFDTLFGAVKGDVSPTAKLTTVTKQLDASELTEGFFLRISDGVFSFDNQSGVEDDASGDGE